MVKTIAIGSDHGGYNLKEALKEILEKQGYRIIDTGTFSKEPCDYPELGYKTAAEVSVGKAARGIVICKTGIGMSIVANKLPGVRAGLCLSVPDAVSAREHNDTNVLVLAADKTGRAKATDIVNTWLITKTLKGRHARRVRQISAIEKKLYKQSIANSR